MSYLWFLIIIVLDPYFFYIYAMSDIQTYSNHHFPFLYIHLDILLHLTAGLIVELHTIPLVCSPLDFFFQLYQQARNICNAFGSLTFDMRHHWIIYTSGTLIFNPTIPLNRSFSSDSTFGSLNPYSNAGISPFVTFTNADDAVFFDEEPQNEEPLFQTPNTLISPPMTSDGQLPPRENLYSTPMSWSRPTLGGYRGILEFVQKHHGPDAE